MEGFFILLGLLVLAFPVIAVVALVKSIGAGERLRRIEFRLAELERRPPASAAAAATTTTTPDSSPPHEAPQEPLPIYVVEHLLREQEAAAEEPREPATPPSQEPDAEAPPPSEPPPPISTTPPPPPQPQISLEERFGTQWVVWVGGVAIALAGFLLVRLSIEQGWFGPGVRVILGGLLALALIAAGEWARRKENLTGITGIQSAHIPSILTAAGTAIAYADVWAAYGLYEFIGSATAFVLLGLVALATLAAALLHGPALAGLGLVGAYVTPIIVASDKPNYWALYIYLAVVTGAAFALARARLWRWLAITAVIFALLWTFPGIADYRVD